MERLTCWIAALSVFGTTVNGIPTHQGERSVGKTLVPRLETNYVGCSEDHSKMLGNAFADAVALAKIASIDFDRGSTAFTHYLREEDGDNARIRLGMIGANNDPTNPPYKFSVRCGTKDDIACKGPKGVKTQSVAFTDPRPDDNDGRREMTICPLFFTATETKRTLDSKKYDDKRNGWCVKDQKFKDFETGGHTLLHEMTHLDAIGKAAGLPTRKDRSRFITHGTDDVDGFGEEYTKAAREFKDAWVNDKDSLADGAIQPWQNAESLAAAATEWWFLQSCKFTDISL